MNSTRWWKIIIVISLMTLSSWTLFTGNFRLTFFAATTTRKTWVMIKFYSFWISLALELGENFMHGKSLVYVPRKSLHSRKCLQSVKWNEKRFSLSKLKSITEQRTHNGFISDQINIILFSLLQLSSFNWIFRWKLNHSQGDSRQPDYSNTERTG